MTKKPHDEYNKKPQPSKGEKVEVVKILILALVSFLAGFALVFLFLRPSSPSDELDGEELIPDETSVAQQNDTMGGYAPSESPAPQAAEPMGYAPQDGTASGAVNEGDAPPEVPPGKTPDGVAIDGKAFYLKCWDSDGIEHTGADCDRLTILEKRFSTRLYIVDKCREQKAGKNSHGKLSVAGEVDFSKMKISFWNGASSDINKSSEIGSCMRESLSGLPIHGIDHKFARYRLFFTVLFGDAAKKKEADEAKKAAKYVAGKGRLVDVTKDRVRVRKTPVDGDIIGKISSGNQVRFIKKKGGWCNIITPNKNEGWMICDALDL